MSAHSRLDSNNTGRPTRIFAAIPRISSDTTVFPGAEYMQIKMLSKLELADQS